MKLPHALRANALFTFTCSLTCLLGVGMIMHHTGAPAQFWVTGLGILLLTYVPMLLFASMRPYDWLVRTIIALDWGYVVLAGLWLIYSWRGADGIGITLQLGSMALVALFAILQQRGLASQIRERTL